MNNEILNRLKSLFSKLSIDLTNGTASAAELKGYCAGLNLVYENMESIFDNLFLDTAGKEGLSMMASLVDEPVRETEDDTRQAVVSALSDRKFFMTLDEFEEAVEAIRPNTFYESDGQTVKLFYEGLPNKKLFENIKRFIKNYLPAHMHLELGGYGISFDCLDELDFKWYEIDSLDIPFSVWDTIAEY